MEGAASPGDACRAAEAVANSPLVKTAFYGGDANRGRILAAVGYSGAAGRSSAGRTVDCSGNAAGPSSWQRRGEAVHASVRDGVASALGGGASLQLVRWGQPADYSEQTASAIFAEKEITVIVQLGLGPHAATVWTCDLSHEYVNINGHYRT